LCCCSDKIDKGRSDEFVVGIKQIPRELSVPKYLDRFISSNVANTEGNQVEIKRSRHNSSSCKECEDKINQKEYEDKINQYVNSDKPDPKYMIRLVNELSSYIKTETIKSLNDPTTVPRKFYETDFFAKQLEYKLIQYSTGKKTLDEAIVKDIPENAIPRLERYFSKNIKEITRRDLLSLKAEKLADLVGLELEKVQQLKLTMMGVRFTSPKPEENQPSREDESSTN
jgi:hypothetical protein